MFQFYDLHAYAIDKTDHSYLVRPVLDQHDDWAVKYWNVLKYRRCSYSKNNVNICRRDILSNLEPSFLTKKYREGNSNNPLYGYCYLAVQTTFYLLQTAHLSPYSGVDDLGNIHYWLRDEIAGEVIDPTASQCDQLSCDPPYTTGTNRK